MYFATIDCGTTNSRIYILDEQLKTVSRGEKKVGVKDTAITGSNQVLKQGLKEVFLETAAGAGLEIKDIRFAITSGMITSEIGLKEIPHLWAPAGLKELARGIEVVNDREVFPVDIPLVFVRGIKNYFPENTTYRDIRKIDFMRGEETQTIGLLSLHPELKLPLTMVVLSSHTKYIHINKQRQICGSLTTLSGQTYEAILKETFIGKSISGESRGAEGDFFDTEVIDTAYDAVMKAGFLRALLMPRFMEVLLNTDWYERKLFINTALIAEDLRATGDFETVGFAGDSGFVLIGHEIRCKILSYLLKKYYGVSSEIKTIYNKKDIDRLSIEGAITIAREAGYLEEAANVK